MQEACGGPEAYAKAYAEKLAEVFAGEKLELDVTPHPVTKKDDGIRIKGRWVIPRSRTLCMRWPGILWVVSRICRFLCALSDLLSGMEEAEIRLAPD